MTRPRYLNDLLRKNAYSSHRLTNIRIDADQKYVAVTVKHSTSGQIAYADETNPHPDLVTDLLHFGSVLNNNQTRGFGQSAPATILSNGVLTTMSNNITADSLGFTSLDDDEDDLISSAVEAGGLDLDPDGEDESATTERWTFPRFAGATEEGDMYLSRSGLGPYDSDVETLVAWLDAPRDIVGAILLEGEPGTGKTALIEAAATHSDRTTTTVVCTPDHTKDSLFLRFMGEGKGDDGSPFTLGPIPYAAKHGHLLYLDEFMLLLDGVKPLIYPLADGRHFLPEGNVDGSALEVHPDFRLVLSSNPMVRGASLPEPIGSRTAGTTLTVETDKAMLVDLGIDEAIIDAWEALGVQNLWRPQIRELRVANYWLDENPAQAVSAFLPSHCPESDRRLIRDTVVGMLGGDIREDGRLVVS